MMKLWLVDRSPSHHSPSFVTVGLEKMFEDRFLSSKSGGSSSKAIIINREKPIGVAVDSAIKSMCIWDLSDIFLTVLYIFLFCWCLRLIRENQQSFWTGRNGGLLWYLGCTSLLCFCRFIGFALVPFASSVSGCNEKYQTFQWELDGSGDMHATLHLGLLVLSTASSALFFSSYSYFAHSLSKVLDILTSEGYGDDDNSSVLSKATKYSLLLFVLYIGVWSSILLLWVARLFLMDQAKYIDSLAQFVVGMAALTTCLMFGLHFLRAFYFLRRNDGVNGDRAAQLSSLLKLRRVLGVCRVCTLCFAIRAVLVMTRTTLGPIWEDLYFLLAEILPTAYMLFTFQKNDHSNSNNNSSDTSPLDSDEIEFSMSDPLQVSRPSCPGHIYIFSIPFLTA